MKTFSSVPWIKWTDDLWASSFLWCPGVTCSHCWMVTVDKGNWCGFSTFVYCSTFLTHLSLVRKPDLELCESGHALSRVQEKRGLEASCKSWLSSHTPDKNWKYITLGMQHFAYFLLENSWLFSLLPCMSVFKVLVFLSQNLFYFSPRCQLPTSSSLLFIFLASITMFFGLLGFLGGKLNWMLCMRTN